MRHCQYTITRHTVHAYAEQVCQRHIPLKDRGRKCKASVLWAVLFWAARRISSLAAACATLRDAPSDTAAHDALLATLPAFAELSRRLNRALQGDLPKALRRRKQASGLVTCCWIEASARWTSFAICSGPASRS